MAQVNLDLLLPQVLAEVPMVPEPMVIQVAAAVAREFCQKTNLWRTSQPITPVDGTGVYALVPPDASADLARILRVSFGPRQLSVATMGELESYDPEWASKTGEPTTFVPQIDGSVLVYPKPDANAVATGNTLAVVATWAPKPTATTMEDSILNRYFRGFAVGVLANLLAMRGQPWSDDPTTYWIEWTRLLQTGRIEEVKGVARRDTRVNAPRFV